MEIGHNLSQLIENIVGGIIFLLVTWIIFWPSVR